MGRVSGKVAIVTGAARGMGTAHARRLVEEGAKVVLTDVLDREGESAARELGANTLFMRHDVSQEKEWQCIVSATEAAFGPVSVLVNNAAIASYGPIETMEEAEYRRIVDVNQVGVFLGMKSVLPSMRRAGGGSIINISSTAGLRGSPPNAIAYSASKFAVRGMSKAAAVELAPYNIRVNSVHPGFISTPLAMQTSAATLALILSKTPAGRPGEPDEVANVVLMLASDETRFSTGAEFVVDGGRTCR